MRLPLLAMLLTVVLSSGAVLGQDTDELILHGVVSNADGAPLLNATVRVQENHVALTDTTGYYELRVPRNGLPTRIDVEVRYVGKRTHRATLQVPEDSSRLRHDVRLPALDLYMDEVTVTAERARESVSNSTYIIDRAAVEQSQAFTLAGLLQLIPGQSITNPSLQGAQTINFRTDASGPYSRNNAFGVGIFMNGREINNNANMQGLNPVENPRVPFRSLEGGRFGDREYETGDTPGGGFDLREIPVGNIEEVEVVRGVASAEHGDILEGGVFIETTAGQSPWNAHLRRSGGEFNLGVNKGFQISPRHILNASLDYLRSNDDPRDQIKTFNRVSSSLLWTSYYGSDRDIRNTLSLSYRTNVDGFKIDPDFDTRKRVFYRDQRVSFSNRLRLAAENVLYDEMTLSASGSWARSKSLLNEYVNPGVQPGNDTKQEGVNEGFFIPPNYRGKRKILGEPVSLSARLKLNRAVRVGDWDLNLAYGGDVSFDANYGAGRLINPRRPVPRNISSSRSTSFEARRPALVQGGAYVESTVSGTIGGHKLVSTIGLRGDSQHGYETLSPRINTRFYLTDHLSLTGAYGLQVKSPGLIHLYPGADYRDYALLNSYTGDVGESVYLAYTHVERDVTDNVQPMRSRRLEAGLEWSAQGTTISTTAYRNVTDNGITVQRRPEHINLPVYEVQGQGADGAPEFVDTGDTERVVYPQGYVTNALYTRNWGVELTASTPKIEVIQTSFSLNLSYNQSDYYNRSNSFNATDPVTKPENEIRYGVYPNTKQKSGRLQGTLTSTHHISDLGLLLTLRTEAFLYDYERTLDNSNRAVAYVNDEAEIVPIPEGEVDDARFDVLDRAPSEGTFRHYPPFAYFNLHANISKDIGKAVRLSFFANNVLNIRPRVWKNGRPKERLNQPPYVGMELRLTL